MKMNKLIINEYPLVVLPKLAKEVGLNEAILLQQIHFWLNKGKHFHENKYWVYNTYADWLEQFPFWSTSTIRRTTKSLEKQELIITSNFNKAGFDKTKWYTINYDELNRVSRRCVQNEQTECSKWTDGDGQNEHTYTIDYPEINDIEEPKAQIEDLLPSFSSIENHEELINKYWDVVSNTRKTGKISDNIKVRMMNKWLKYDLEVVEYALKSHAENHSDKKEEYTLGIMRNTSKEEAKWKMLDSEPKKVADF